MQVPSRLNEYPDGTTRPTTERWHPSFSSLSISRGSTDSDEDVPSTMNSSSRSSRDQPEDREAVHSRNEAEHAEHEQQAGGVEAQHQHRQRRQCRQRPASRW